MNAYDNSTSGMSGNAFDRWVQRTDVSDDSAITKMQHHFWVTKQALSRKLGKKEDECIVASDAELDAKLELFRSIQETCSYLQRVIDKYQERLCNLAQEENAMGRFLKEAGKQDQTRAGKMMSAVGKAMSYSGQQRLALRAPLVRLYQEVETFRQRAIEDTLQNVQAMEKARTEYRAALSWMKNISQELDPDTSKQLERFRKVQVRVRRGKASFDNLALDCLQKVDLLAAARCNMFSHALVLYQNTLLDFTKKSTRAFSTIANSFKGYQHYDFMVVRELVEPSSKLAQETGGNDILEDKDKLLFFDTDYHDDVEEAQEVKPTPEIVKTNSVQEGQLLDIDNDPVESLDIGSLDLSSHIAKKEDTSEKPEVDHNKQLDEFFASLASEEHPAANSQPLANKPDRVITQASLLPGLDESLADLDLAMDSFGSGSSASAADFLDPVSLKSASTNMAQNQPQESLQLLSTESIALLDDILNGGPSTSSEWDAVTEDTFLPPGILKQSLGEAMQTSTRGNPSLMNSDKTKKSKNAKQKGWLDLFAELDPLVNNPLENLQNSSNAPA
ncbi:islet cell autoantigen 1 [Orussus abietinus]|uniref:islet cell autoantigen 1 n=1 Tax=Orussus abietinus TaxID=222816 RepID=UPI000625E2B6|nr:islet cell autoantigen 1 [Orussus abietinus]